MRKFSISVCMALLLITYLAEAKAEMTQYQIRGQVSGSPVDDIYLGFFEFDITTSDSIIQEVLPSGVKHNEYDFFTFSGSPLPQYGYSIYNGTEGGTFVSQYGGSGNFSIDQYLNLDGSSILTIHGYSNPTCHGGCTFESEFTLNYKSAQSGLFNNLATPLSFEALSSASGNSIYNYQSYIPGSAFPSLYNKTEFTISSTVSVVPELETWIFLLSGLGFLTFFLNRKVNRF